MKALREALGDHAEQRVECRAPLAILLMAVVCVSLYVIFKKREWL
ncbi:hypothetical protein [Streptomyces sp. NPDC054838]